MNFIPPPILELTTKLGNHDAVTLNHCSRAGAIAGKLLPGNYNRVYLSPENAYLGMLLHDIGKLNIPVQILNKPDELSEEEREIMRMHPRYGVELIRASYSLDNIVLYMVGGHHQINGYPRREDIYVDTERRDFESRELLERVTIIDVFDASIDRKRPYNKTPLTTGEATEGLIRKIPAQKEFALKVKEAYEELNTIQKKLFIIKGGLE